MGTNKSLFSKALILLSMYQKRSPFSGKEKILKITYRKLSKNTLEYHMSMEKGLKNQEQWAISTYFI